MPPKVLAIVLAGIVLVVALGVAAASKPACTREVVSGPLVGGGQFTARDVAVYGSGVFPGNPLVVRIEGNITASDWYDVRLPGVRVPDQLRIFASGATVTAYFLSGETLSFYAEMKNASTSAAVNIFYIPGTASWDGHFELDLDAKVLALVAKVDWRGSVMFRHIDLLLVSGEIHTVPPSYYGSPPVAASTSVGGGFASPFAPRLASDASDELAAFTIPSSTDNGIYVVHRVSNVDIPGSNALGRATCEPKSFFLRVYESPVLTSEIVVAHERVYGAGAPWNGSASATTTGLPLTIELGNAGGLPWMPGRADLYRDGILAGSDLIPYTPRDGTARLVMGKALDIEVTRQVEVSGGIRYVNHTVTNRDVTPYTVELSDLAGAANVTDPGSFLRVDGSMVASVQVRAGETVSLGWSSEV